MRAVRIGTSVIAGNVFLAPLAGFSNAAFRSVCIENGAYLTYTEMISAEGVVRGGRKSLALVARAPNEPKLAFQIFASDADCAARAVEILAVHRPALIDLNCGCPVPKVIKAGAGAALLRRPELIARITAAMRAASDIPVTVKIRSGWDAQEINYLETASAAVHAGAALVCLHARTRSQNYAGRADWSHIRRLKQGVDVPVFGSGDLFTAEAAVDMLRSTGCDGVMLARGAIGNPFLFRAIDDRAHGRPETPPTARERLETALRQLRLAADFDGEQKACREMRKHFCAYSKGLNNGAGLRSRIVHASTLEDYRQAVDEYLAD